ncbi:MAG: FtsQ-type POTRA domain-containing protein [Elusimicrobia bacterium]|nr:FtsQ-type POTRA domain-containing protein [Elusimicrobiota bacterium]
MKYKPKRRSIHYTRKVTLRSKFKQERYHQWGKRALVLAIVAGVGVGGWWAYNALSRFVFCADCFVIRSIEVRGGKNVTQSEIRALLPFRVGDNMFRIGVSEAENDIRQCKPELKSIHISRRWKSVVVHIAERIPLVTMAVGAQRQGLDEDNIPFPLRGRLSPASLPEISAAEPDMRLGMLQFAKTLSRSAGDIFAKTQWLSLDGDQLIVGLAGNTKILWGPMDAGAFSGKLQRMRQVLADGAARFSDIEYVNLLFFDDGRILLKPRSAAVAAKVPAA